MRVLVLSDIHANLAALMAVLRGADGQWDECWMLGDTAGYGPDFLACFDCLLRLNPSVWLAGNHDAALLGDLPQQWFNQHARWALDFQRQECQAAELLAFRERIELSGLIRVADGVAVHGSPAAPLLHYLITDSDRIQAIEKLGEELKFFCYGHTHQQEGFCYTEYNLLRRLPPRGGHCSTQLLLFNPGSVGQPRDRDPRACYALFDTETLQLRLERVSYPIEQVRDKMQQQGFPSFLYERLSLGR